MSGFLVRRHYSEDTRLLRYAATDWSPKFNELKRAGSERRILLKNLETGEFEYLDFTITGVSESPITTTKWVEGKIRTTDRWDAILTFDYVDGQLVDITATIVAKSLPVEICARRTENLRYPAEITNFDIFSPAI